MPGHWEPVRAPGAPPPPASWVGGSWVSEPTDRRRPQALSRSLWPESLGPSVTHGALRGNASDQQASSACLTCQEGERVAGAASGHLGVTSLSFPEDGAGGRAALHPAPSSISNRQALCGHQPTPPRHPRGDRRQGWLHSKVMGIVPLSWTLKNGQEDTSLVSRGEDSTLPVRGAGARSLVRELGHACRNQSPHMRQPRPGAATYINILRKWLEG